MQSSDQSPERLVLLHLTDEQRASIEQTAAEAGMTVAELMQITAKAAIAARNTGTGDDDGKPEGWEPEEEDEEETGAADENDDTPQDEARFMDALRRTLERMNIAVQDVLMQALRAVMNSLTKVSAAAVDLMFTAETDEAVGLNGPQPQGHHPAQPEPQAATPACGGPARDERAAQSCPPCAANSAEKAEAGHAASETGNAGGASARADQARPPHGVQQADASGAGERDRGQTSEPAASQTHGTLHGTAAPRTSSHTVTMGMPAAETPLRVHTPFDGMGVNDMARMASFGSVSGFPATTGSGGASFEAVCVMNQSAPGTYSGTMNAGFSSVRDTPTMSREPQTDWAWQFAAQQQQASAGRASFTPNDFVHSQPAGERTSGFRSNAYGSGFEVPGEALESERVQTADNTQNHGHSAQNEADNDREAET